MNINELPVEILQNILERLYGSEVISCREVCRRWRETIDDLPDSSWQQICHREYFREDYIAAHKKYGLTWREAFKALNSWSNINTAEMNIKEHELCTSVQIFKVLPNRIIACLQNRRHITLTGYSDTILYYSLDNCQINEKVEYDLPFSPRQYDESDHFIVLPIHDGRLCIILKANKKKFFVGDLDKYESMVEFSIEERFGEYTIIDKEVYFKNCTDEVIYVSKLVEEDGEPTIITVPLDAFKENHESFEENIVAFTIKDGNVNILTDEGNIYIHNNADFEFIGGFDPSSYDMFCELSHFGFNWKSRAIYHWLSLSNMAEHYNAFYTHGRIILMARTFQSKVYMFYCRYLIDGLVDLLRIIRGRTSRTVNMKGILNINDTPYKCIKQLDIVETPTSHKVIVLGQHRLFVLDFEPSHIENMKLGHSKKSNRQNKQQAGNKKKVHSTKAKRSGHKTNQHNHRYATRSKNKA